MKLELNRAWWCSLTLPILGAYGCNTPAEPSLAQNIVLDPPRTSISRLADILMPSIKPEYFEDNKVGSIQSAKITESDALKLNAIESTLSDRVKNQLFALSRMWPNLGIQLQIKLVAAVKSKDTSSDQIVVALTKLANSSSALIDEIALRSNKIAESSPGVADENRILQKAVQYYKQHNAADGNLFPKLFEHIEALVEKVRNSKFPSSDIDFVELINKNPEVSRQVDASIKNYLMRVQRYRSSDASILSQINPRKIEEFKKDFRTQPKLEHFVGMLRNSQACKSKTNVDAFLPVLFEDLSTHTDLQRAQCAPINALFLVNLSNKNILKSVSYDSLARALMEIKAPQNYRIANLNWVLSQSDFSFWEVQQIFNASVMPLINELRETQITRGVPVADLLYKDFRNYFLPNDAWPENVQILASSGITYNNWATTERIIDSIGAVSTDFSKNKGVVSITDIFSHENPNLMQSSGVVENANVVASENFKNFDFKFGVQEAHPLRSVILAGRDFSDNASQGERFLNFGNRLKNALDKRLIHTDLLFASTANGIFEYISSLEISDAANFESGRKVKPDLILVVIGLGLTGPQIKYSQNIGAMFDGTVIMDKADSSDLHEYNLKCALQKCAMRFNKITLLVFSDAAASFIK